MNPRRRLWLGWLAAFLLPLIAQGQYSMHEAGFELGPGFALLKGSGATALGPAGNVNAFFSHYACGKAYGFHITAGATALFPGTADGSALVDDPSSSRLGLQFAGLDLGLLGKIRTHEKHWPREWAVFLGPKIYLPFLAHTSNGPLRDDVDAVGRFLPGLQVSVQFRRPAGRKKSWFIHPGAEYYFLPAFQSDAAGLVSPLYLFLNFGYAFWSQKG